MKMSRELEEELLVEKVNAHALVVAHAGTDQLIGEILEVHADGSLDIKNPKRIVRIERVVEPEGILLVRCVVGSFDFLLEGKIAVYPHLKYYVRDQTERTKIVIYSALIDYFDQLREEQPPEVAPQRSPFKRG